MGLELLYSLSVSLMLTIILEVGFLFCCGIREKKDVMLLILVNIITNPLVVIIYFLVLRYSDWNKIVIVILLELFAILTEGYYFRTYGKTFRRPLLLALGANMFSFCIGLALKLLL